MADPSLYQLHVDYLLGRSLELAGLLVDRTLEAMRASSADLALASDRSLLFQVAEAVQTKRGTFQSALAHHLQCEIQAQHQRGNARQQPERIHIDELTLVDEEQAEHEIEVARTVQLIDLTAEWELRELQSFTSALQGETRLRPQENPFRPAVYSKALSAAARALNLAPKERNLLLRIAGRALSHELKALYAQASERLRQQGLRPLAYQAPVTPKRRPSQSTLNVTQPGSLESLLDKLPASLQMPAAQHHTAQPLANSAHTLTFQPVGEPPPAPRRTGQPRTYTQEQVTQLLSKLFAQMHLDQDVQPDVRAMINQLQPAVMRVAHEDPQILQSDQHPAWQLINQLAAYASGYTDVDQSGLRDFLQFAQPRIQRLVPPPGPTIAQLEAALADMHSFIEARSHHQLKAAPQAIARMEEADLRLSVRPVLQQQIQDQIGSTRIKPGIKAFLLGPWVDLLTQLMASGSPDEDETQAMVACVDELLQSLQRPRSIEEREALRRALPPLIDRLKRGMACIQLPQDQQDAFLNELMGVHGHHLLANPKPIKAQADQTPADLVTQMRKEMDAQHNAATSADRHKQVIDTNLGSLPTVPMSYGSTTPHTPARHTAADWAQSLQKGVWCKLLLQGHWTTAHLIWVSANRQFFMFTSDHAGRMHSLTRRALERLRTEGLATDLQDRSLMQRAVDSMLQDLDDSDA